MVDRGRTGRAWRVAAMTSEPVLVGIDAGTKRVKAVVVDLAGHELATTSAATPWVVDGSRVEMDALVLADTVRGVVADAVASCGRPVRGVGVTSVGESGVLLDGRGEPVSPIVAWYDQRGAVDRVARTLPQLATRTGVPFNPIATVFKLAELAPSELRGRRWLNVAEWVIHALGGEQFAEISLAGRTGLHDLHTGAWWPEALELLGVDETLFPGAARFGVEGAGTATFDPVAGATLAVAGHDHQVAAFAVGATDPGWHFESLGTADALTVAISPPVAESIVAEIVEFGATIGRTVVADRLIVIIGLRTGQILDRITRLLGLASADERGAVSARAAELDAHPRLTVAFAAGEVTIAGIGEGIGPEQLWRAAVAAADDRTTDVTARFERWFGAPDGVILGGGWLHDPAVAAATRRRFPNAIRTRYGEPGAVGAAAMAGIAAGVLDGPFAGALEPAPEPDREPERNAS
jgi:sugar (pentulose or hexulose) kinase